MTSDDQHRSLQQSLGAYVLGALSPAESAALQAHLATCADCRREHQALLPAASVLGELKRRGGWRSESTGSGPEAPDASMLGLLDREIGREIAREHRTAWVRRAGLAAVAGAAASTVLVAGLLLTSGSDTDGGSGEPVGVAAETVAVEVSDVDVSASAALVDHTWGLEVKLSGRGFDDGDQYRVAVIGTDGRRYPAGAFVGTGSRVMLCNLSSAVLRSEATGFEVRGRDGEVVASSSFA